MSNFVYSDGHIMAKERETRNRNIFEKRYQEFEKKMNWWWDENNIEDKLYEDGKCVLYAREIEDSSAFNRIEKIYAHEHALILVPDSELEKRFLHIDALNNDVSVASYAPVSLFSKIFNEDISLVLEFMKRHHFDCDITVHCIEQKPKSVNEYLKKLFCNKYTYEYKLWIGLPKEQE